MVSACGAFLNFVAGPVLGQQPQEQLLRVCLCEMKPPQQADNGDMANHSCRQGFQKACFPDALIFEAQSSVLPSSMPSSLTKKSLAAQLNREGSRGLGSSTSWTEFSTFLFSPLFFEIISHCSLGYPGTQYLSPSLNFSLPPTYWIKCLCLCLLSFLFLTLSPPAMSYKPS